MAEPQEGLVEDLKKALHHAQKNNRPEQAKQFARLLTAALNPQPQQPQPDARTDSHPSRRNLRVWPLRGDVDPSDWK